MQHLMMQKSNIIWTNTGYDDQVKLEGVENLKSRSPAADIYSFRFRLGFQMAFGSYWGFFSVGTGA